MTDRRLARLAGHLLRPNRCTAAAPSQKKLCRVGVVGYGKVGQFMVQNILARPELFELVFLCDPVAPDTVRAASAVPDAAKLFDLDKFEAHCKAKVAGTCGGAGGGASDGTSGSTTDAGIDLVVEVAHPDVSRAFGLRFLRVANYMVASTSVFAERAMEEALLGEAHAPTGHGICLPSGALWGVRDLQKMSDSGTLAGLHVTIRKHPLSLKLLGRLAPVLKRVLAENEPIETLLFEGTVRDLCPLAPNNVNTMATAALAVSSSLGFDGTRATLICDPRLTTMAIDVEARGKEPAPGKPGLVVHSNRVNPSAPGAVTGMATFQSFLRSLLLVATTSPGDGVHFF